MPCLLSYHLKLFIVDIYQYIAYDDPYVAKSICNKFGVDTSRAQTEEDMAEALRQLVAQQGMEALSAIVDVHPDKDIILEMSGPKTTSKDCGCKDKKSSTSIADSYVQQAQSSGFSLQQGNTFIIAAALILAVAVIASSKSKS